MRPSAEIVAELEAAEKEREILMASIREIEDVLQSKRRRLQQLVGTVWNSKGEIHYLRKEFRRVKQLAKAGSKEQEGA